MATKRDGDTKDAISVSTLHPPVKKGVNAIQKQTVKENEIAILKNNLGDLECQVSSYREKIANIEKRLNEIDNYLKEDDIKLWDFADSSGEWLFVSRRLDQSAKTIFIPNKAYYLVRLDSVDSPTPQIQPIVVESHLVLGLDEEGEKVAESNMFAPKKSMKDK
jgi:hypothetical protein